MSGWLWMLRNFGFRLTFGYWRVGRKQGWIKTDAERRAFERHFFGCALSDEETR